MMRLIKTSSAATKLNRAQCRWAGDYLRKNIWVEVWNMSGNERYLHSQYNN